MPGDLKIGLTLGILLLGVAGALFFRHPSEESPLPGLASADDLNAQLAERPRQPYSLGFDDGLSERTAFTRQPPSVRLRDILDEDETIGGAPRGAAGADPLDREYEPIRPEEKGAAPTVAASSATAPRGTAASKAAGTGPGRTSTVSSAQPAPEVRYRQHRIRPGDTLTRLAAYYLGSQSRYMEIFEANRDVLAVPHRLPLGATIRIPPRERPATDEGASVNAGGGERGKTDERPGAAEPADGDRHAVTGGRLGTAPRVPFFPRLPIKPRSGRPAGESNGAGPVEAPAPKK